MSRPRLRQRAQDGATRVEGFLSWLRGVLQGLGDHSPILIVSGSIQARIAEVLDVLVHDGYLAAHGRDHIFPSRLLRDWWAARFRDHHVSVADRSADAAEGPAR